MPGISYRATQWATMKPDVYGGPKCDQIVPRWHVYAEGDKDSDYIRGALKLDGRTFPPGTKVTIQEPVCPDCGDVRSPIYPLPSAARSTRAGAIAGLIGMSGC